MNIRQLAVFQAVCEEHSFTKAANKLFMTQPAVSHVIQELEAETGCVLFDRIARKIYLTESGRLFLEKAVRVLEAYDDLCQNDILLEELAPVRVGSSITIACFWLPQIVKEFGLHYENTPVVVEVNSAKVVEEKLLTNEIDIAFIEGVIHSDRLHKIPFSSYDMSVVCHPEHPFAGRKKIRAEELDGEKLLLRERGSAIRDTFDSSLLLFHLFLEPIWTSVNTQVLIEAVRAGVGISVLPDHLVEDEVKDGSLCLVEVEGLRMRNQNHVVYHKDKHLSKPMQKLISIVFPDQ